MLAMQKIHSNIKVPIMYDNFFVVPYEIIGQRESGTKLVCATNKATAKRLVRGLYDDFVCRQPVESFVDYCVDYGEEPADEFASITGGVLPQDVKINTVFDIECGT